MKNNKALMTLVAIGIALYFLGRKKAPAGAKKSPCGGVGDPNMDGWVSQADIALTQQFIMGTITPTAEQFRRADVNGDGMVNMGDVIRMERYLLGLDSTFPVCSQV